METKIDTRELFACDINEVVAVRKCFIKCWDHTKNHKAYAPGLEIYFRGGGTMHVGFGIGGERQRDKQYDRIAEILNKRLEGGER